MSSILPARVSQDRIPTLYRRIAPVYDLWAGLTESRARKRSLSAAGVVNGQAVLEVAVGTGLLFRELLKANPDGTNVGLDLTEAMLAKARAKAEAIEGARFELVTGSALALPFDDASFDVIINNYMFDLLPEADFATVLSEMKRVLRPGGRLVLVNMTTGNNPWEWVYRLSPGLLGGCRGVRLEPFVRDAGFVGVTREELSQLGFASELVTARKPAD